MRKSILFTAATFLLLTSVAYAGPDFGNVEMKIVPVAGSVYMVQGYGGDVGVCVGEDGVIMVDNWNKGLLSTDQWIEIVYNSFTMEEKGINPEQVISVRDELQKI